MLTEGTMIELREDKTHFDGTEDVKLKAGTCGMVVGTKRVGSDIVYIVDVGPYGQWYCKEDELIVNSTMIVEEDDEEEDEDISVLDDSPVVSGDFEADLARRILELEKERG